MALSVRALVQLTAEQTTALDLTTVSAPLSLARQLTYTDGAGAGQADLIWSDTRTVSSSATDTLDLAGSLTGALGNTLTFARIKGLVVAARPTNTTTLQVARPESNGVPLLSAQASIPVPPGGLFVWLDRSAAGVAVTADTADRIDIVNGSGASATYDIVIIGAAS